ncbi:MAG: hypothetical protein EOM23_06295 [Candidatus Moranbacteria bacterium]|nr:hypothetical protein [Candidatus Moranbacteria bacterium]
MRVGKYLAVTNHAIERLEQRMNITGYKEISKAVKKAWYNTQPICEEFWKSSINLKNNGCTTYFYKKYKQCIFCFQKKYSDVVLLTVFPEDGEYLKNEANTKKTFRRNDRKSILPKVHSGENAPMWGKDYFRTRFDLRRKADKRKIRDRASLRETSRSKHISRPWRHGQEISRMGGIDKAVQFE